MYGYRSTEATRRLSATPSLRAARPTVGLSVVLDERIEGTSRAFASVAVPGHQWKPNALMEPPVN